MDIGIKGSIDRTVERKDLALHVGSGTVSVLATPVMIAWIEGAAASSVQDLLPEGRTTVGTLMQITHEAATPEGMRVHVETELTAVSENGRGLTFSVKAWDQAGLIGQGIHERVIVDRDRFEKRALEKAGI